MCIRDSLGAGALLSVVTDGMEEDEVRWVAPRDLASAARELRAAVREGRPGTDRILGVYEFSASGADPFDEEFARDLEDVEALARWAEEQGATRMTLEINW
jgi:hypothetical protein